MRYTWIDVWAKWWIVTINDKLEVESMRTIPTNKEWVDREELKVRLDMLNWYIAIEDVHSIYGMSAKSNFNFWFIKWFKYACVADRDVELVAPKVWQKTAWDGNDIVYITKWNKQVKDTKATSLKAAQRIFPWVDWRVWRQRVQQDWLYDSALIAYWLYMKVNWNA